MFGLQQTSTIASFNASFTIGLLTTGWPGGLVMGRRCSYRLSRYGACQAGSRQAAPVACDSPWPRTRQSQVKDAVAPSMRDSYDHVSSLAISMAGSVVTGQPMLELPAAHQLTTSSGLDEQNGQI